MCGAADAGEEGRLEESWDAKGWGYEDDAEGGVGADEEVLYEKVLSVGVRVGEDGGGGGGLHFDIHQAIYQMVLQMIEPMRSCLSRPSRHRCLIRAALGEAWDRDQVLCEQSS